MGVPNKTVFEKRDPITKNKFDESLEVLEGMIIELFKNLTFADSFFPT